MIFVSDGIYIFIIKYNGTLIKHLNMTLGKLIRTIDDSSDQWEYEENLMAIKKYIMNMGIDDLKYINLFADNDLVYVLEIVFQSEDKTIDDSYLDYIWNDLDFKKEEVELSTLKDSNYLYLYPK